MGHLRPRARVCLNAHEQYGYPASALLGQMMIENGTSDSGSDLGRLYHNYGGVKYAGYDYGGLITVSLKCSPPNTVLPALPTRPTRISPSTEDDDSYMKYRCEHLYKQSNYTRVANYQKAIDTNNSELFLCPRRRRVLHRVAGQLYRPVPFHLPSLSAHSATLTPVTAEEFKNQYSGTTLIPGGGQDYQSADQWQKDIVNACSQTPSGSQPLRHMDNKGLCKSRSSRRRQRQYAARQSGIRCQLQPETRHHRPLPDKGRNAHLRPIRLQHPRR